MQYANCVSTAAPGAVSGFAARQGSIEDMTYMLQQQEDVLAGTLALMLHAAGANDHLVAAQYDNVVLSGLLSCTSGHMTWLHGPEQRDVTHHYTNKDI
jgi:hypothetical protein